MLLSFKLAGKSMSDNDLVAPLRGRIPPKAVAYLAGRGLPGVTLGPETAMEATAERVGELWGRIEALRLEVDRVDRGLEAVRDALEFSQPPMWHRVAIRWWREGGRRGPVLVRIRPTGGGRLCVEKVKGAGIKLRTDRGFALNADIAAKAVRLYWILARRRTGLLRLVGLAERALASARADRLSAGASEVDRWAGEAVTLKGQAIERLRMVGYEVTEADDSAGVLERQMSGPEGLGIGGE